MKEFALAKTLRIGAFRNLWLSQLLSSVVLNILFFSLMIRVYELTHSNTAVSIMLLTVTVPNVILGAVAGVLADRWERKLLMFCSHFLRVFAVLAFLISSESLVWLYVLAALIGAIAQFFFPAEAATIPELVKDKKLLLTANSLFTLTFFGSVIVGNVLAGPFLRWFGPDGTFLVVAMGFLLASAFTYRLPGPDVWQWIKSTVGQKQIRLETIHQQDRSELIKEFWEGIDYIKRSPTVRAAILVMAAGQSMIAILGSIAPGFADAVLHEAVRDVSVLVMAPAALGMIVGAIIVGQFGTQHAREKLISMGFIVMAVVLIMFSQVDRVAQLVRLPLIPVSLVVLAFLGITNAFLDIPVNTLLQESTEEKVRSRVYGVIGTVVGAVNVIPTILSGTIADVWGVRSVMVCAGVGLLLLALYNRKGFQASLRVENLERTLGKLE